MTDALATALELAPLIERVHGTNHPELTRVRELTFAIDAETDPARRADLFAELRSVTDNYALPADACEAYTGTYQALQQADQRLTRS